MFNLYTPLPGFLELINNMLTSGMVPALFPDDEKEGIIGQVINDWLSKCSRGGGIPYLKDAGYFLGRGFEFSSPLRGTNSKTTH